MVDTTMDGLAWLRKQVEQADTDLLREMVKLFCERLMAEEADAICGASYGERSEERTNRRNGLWGAGTLTSGLTCGSSTMLRWPSSRSSSFAGSARSSAGAVHTAPTNSRYSSFGTS